MTIFEIDSRITDLIDPETGELLDYEAFNQLQMERREKIENMALWCKELTADAEAIKNEINVLTKRKQAKERRSTSLLSYIGRILDGEKFETPRCVVTSRRSKALQVDDNLSVVGWCRENGYEDCIVLEPPKISKKAISKLMKDGIDVPYTHFVERLNVGVK